MTIWLPDADDAGHEYDSKNPDDDARLMAFMDKMSHYVDKDGVLWINKNFPVEGENEE